ncbi:MAG: hypothetical protein N3F66_05315 [Spirochaetes bacterium]|nr:hypothetical protein [Spirochaetota bacterium]
MYNVKTILTLSFIFVSTLVFAQHHHGKGMMYHMYNAKTEATVSGVVDDIINESHPCCGSTMNHFYIKVKSNNETVKVFLGPTDYVNQNIKVKKGDSVTIFGSKTTMNNETVIIAKTIKTKEKEFALRNDDGTPKWAGQMKYKKQQ